MKKASLSSSINTNDSVVTLNKINIIGPSLTPAILVIPKERMTLSDHFKAV